MSREGVRFDKTDHWPEHDKRSSRSLCTFCRSTSLSHVFCTKCNVPLCFTRKRNCFRQFHVRGQVNRYRNQQLDVQRRKKEKTTKKKKTASRDPAAKSNAPERREIKKSKTARIAAVYSAPTNSDLNQNPTIIFG